mmetsp:Transcript_69422/g.62284  ORF Transcript_69422/g.62284 Transcript_69422/m.62284 type:complete len:230 (+) Transcript_69422:80-769(+)
MNLLLSTTTNIVDNAAIAHGVNVSSLKGRKDLQSRRNYQSESPNIDTNKSESVSINLPNLTRFRPLNLPSLQKRNAIHVKEIHHINSQNSQQPDHNLIKKFNTHHSFRQSVNIVIKSFSDSKHDETDIVPLDIIQLCQKYIYSNDEEIMAFAFTLYKSLKKLKQKCISKKILYLLVKNYLSTNKLNKDISNVKRYINKLLELKYITRKKLGSNTLYRIPMDKELIFSSM